MAKKPKEITPFFKLRWMVNDTHEALTHELLMVLQVFDMILSRENGLPPAMKASVKERRDALRKIVTSEAD